MMIEKRWLYHAEDGSKIFEEDQLKEALKEGWKFWPWEIDSVKVEKKKDKKQKLIVEEKKEEIITEVVLTDDSHNTTEIEKS